MTGVKRQQTKTNREVSIMNQLDEKQLQTHVPIVGWLLIVTNALFLVLAAFLFVLLVGIGLAVGEPEARNILSIVGTSLAALFTVLGIPGIVAGAGLLARQAWGRILAIVVAILSLLNFPIGTIIGIYAIWVLLQEAATAYFK
jgi:hypothetical protein